ncbi:Dynactin subunit 1 [Apophysomyces sp. BC1021]|nr:Dynactin subunit 1 [Apophysomyces sp. BC1021]
MSSTTQTANTTPRTSLTTPSPSASKLTSRPSLLAKLDESSRLRVGTRVAVDSMGIVGTLKYIGPTQFKAGTWAGIQLDIIGTGKNNGSVNGVRYFTCPPRTGIFVTTSKIIPVDQNTTLDSPTEKRRSTPSSTLRSRASRYIGMSQHIKSPVKPEQSKSAIMSSPTWMARRRSHTPSLPPSPEESRSRISLQPTTTGIPSPATTPTSSTTQDSSLVKDTKKDWFPSVTPEAPKIAKLRDGTSSIDLYSNWTAQANSATTNQISGNLEHLNHAVNSIPNPTAQLCDQPENDSSAGQTPIPVNSDNVWERAERPNLHDNVIKVEEEKIPEVVQGAAESATRVDTNLTITMPVEHATILQHQVIDHTALKTEIERHVLEKEQLAKKMALLEEQQSASQIGMDALKRDLADKNQTLESYQAHIHQLEQSVEDLKRAGMESLELYESAVKLHREDMQKVNAKLTEEQRKVETLETEREDLRKAGLEAIEAYEKTINNLKNQCKTIIDTKHLQKQDTSAKIDQLEQEIAQLKENATSETTQTQLEESLKQATKALEQEREERKKVENAKEELEQEIKNLQAEHEAQVTSYTQDLEKKTQTEDEVRELRKSKQMVERDLMTIQEKLADAENTLIEVRAHDHLVEDTLVLLEQERQQHANDMEMLRIEIEKLEIQNAALAKEKERSIILAGKSEKGAQRQIEALKNENTMIQNDHEKLKMSHAEMETECIRLMDEVERLHTAEPIVLLSQATDDEEDERDRDSKCQAEERINQLETQICESQSHLERVLIEHAVEVRQLTDKHAKESQARWQQIQALHRDVVALERLIENKTFKEADMEEALKRERRHTQRLQYELGDITGMAMQRKITVSKRWTAMSKPRAMDEDEVAYCEICEESGHDLMSCSTVLERCSIKQHGLKNEHTIPIIGKSALT